MTRAEHVYAPTAFSPRPNELGKLVGGKNAILFSAPRSAKPAGRRHRRFDRSDPAGAMRLAGSSCPPFVLCAPVRYGRPLPACARLIVALLALCPR